MVPIHTMHRVLEKFEMPALRGGGADVPGAKLGVVDAARVPIPLYEVLLLPFYTSEQNVGAELKGVRCGVERRRGAGIESGGPWAERDAGR